ncbi:MAG TPA: NADH-quinone oxidoreductase subunit N [Thermoanaerobaculia bacterium]|jgi:NADH-quinone oxidoreductase subunit N|nr:NADH-quinone oxidoreductase subunit N [Thermoanaerobaculia bacterium]
MSAHFDWMLLLPELVLTAAGVVILLLDAIAPSLRRSFTTLAVLAALGAGYAAYYVTPLHHVVAGQDGTFNGLIETSPLTLAATLIVLLSTVLSLLASQSYLRREGILAGEYHALLLWCAVGLLLMLRATELLTVFLALETLSLCLYCLAAFHRRISLGSEAAIKYFLMGAFVSAFALYGIALVYGATGSTRFAGIGHALAAQPSINVLASLGFLFLVAAFGFKMSLAPFHAWSPDTYQGAPSPFVAFLSVAPKVASAVVLYRLLDAVVQGGTAPNSHKWSTVVAALSVASMLVGNFLALVQRDVKRMLAYSGVAHMGYLLLALVVVDQASLMPVLVYLLAYVLMNAGAFTVVSLLYSRPGEQHLIADLAGWGYRYPLLGGCLAVCMLSLGGIPPTLGFLGKYVVFLNAVGDGLVGLAVVGVLASLVGVFYYLRVVYYLYMKPETRQPEGLLIDVWGRTAAVLAALGTLALGLWPTGLLQWLMQATAVK